MSEERLSERLWWHPIPIPDPAPEIWRIIEELDRGRLVDVANVVLETQIAIARAQLSGMEKIAGVVGSLRKQ